MGKKGKNSLTQKWIHSLNYRKKLLDFGSKLKMERSLVGVRYLDFGFGCLCVG